MDGHTYDGGPANHFLPTADAMLERASLRTKSSEKGGPALAATVSHEFAKISVRGMDIAPAQSDAPVNAAFIPDKR